MCTVKNHEARRRQGGITVTFPIKLHTMLQEIEQSGTHADVVCWNAEGNAFLILKPKEFTTVLLPGYFRTNKFNSFQRQLNAYGFTRGNFHSGQEDRHIYHHDIFHRDHPGCLDTIKRRGSRTSRRGRDKVQSQRRRDLSMAIASFDLSIAIASFDLTTSFGMALIRKTKDGDRRDSPLDEAAAVVVTDAASPCSSLEDDTRRDSALDEAAAAVVSDDASSYSSSEDFLSMWCPEKEQLTSDSDDEF